MTTVKEFATTWPDSGKPRLVRVVTCDCGDEIWCYDFTQTCSCGVDYNMSGQRLAPRSQWGEETGEHWSKCY